MYRYSAGSVPAPVEPWLNKSVGNGPGPPGRNTTASSVSSRPFATRPVGMRSTWCVLSESARASTPHIQPPSGWLTWNSAASASRRRNAMSAPLASVPQSSSPSKRARSRSLLAPPSASARATTRSAPSARNASTTSRASTLLPRPPQPRHSPLQRAVAIGRSGGGRRNGDVVRQRGRDRALGQPGLERPDERSPGGAQALLDPVASADARPVGRTGAHERRRGRRARRPRREARAVRRVLERQARGRRRSCRACRSPSTRRGRGCGRRRPRRRASAIPSVRGRRRTTRSRRRARSRRRDRRRA